MGDKPAFLPFGLYALLDDSVRPGLDLAEAARAVLEGGAGVIQLRLKRLPDRQALALCCRVVELARPLGARVLVNDRVDLALLSGADGVHLGDDDLPVAQARKLLGPAALIGATTRNLAQIERAAAEGADHVGLGPVFATSTKQIPHPLLGVEGLARIAAVSPLPIVAIAGLRLGNLQPVARAGARCAAVASGLLEASDLRERARALQAEFCGI
ncbi:MAG: thiamine phosphate synthase [Myxococcaceae bacterium]|nr:thiamine phosphate synthase [Myxococcaceae bacterium]